MQTSLGRSLGDVMGLGLVTQHPGDDLIGRRVKIANPGYWANGRVVVVESVFSVMDIKCFSFRAIYDGQPQDQYGLPISKIQTIIKRRKDR